MSKGKQNGKSCKPHLHTMQPAAGQATTSHNMQAIDHELAESNSGTRALSHAAAGQQVSRLSAAGQAMPQGCNWVHSHGTHSASGTVSALANMCGAGSAIPQDKP